MLHRTSLFILCALLVTTAVRAQGVNNDHPIDSADIQNALRFLGVEVYKFPVVRPDPSHRYFVNTIIEEYRFGKLTKRHDVLADNKHRYADNEIVEQVTPILDDTTQQFIRVYAIRNQNDVALGTRIVNVENELALNTPGKGWITDSRAMDFTSVGQTPTPLVVYYGRHGSSLMHCPGDRSVAQIPKDYDYAAILYGQLVPLP